MTKVKVISLTAHRVGVNVPGLNFKREWLKRGASVDIDRNILEELMYDNGFRYMIDNGMLYIEDMATKIELGIEAPDTTAPTAIIALDEKMMKRYLSVLPYAEFEAKVSDLTREQVASLAQFAIDNKLIDFDKCELLKKLTGRNIIKAIELEKQDKED